MRSEPSDVLAIVTNWRRPANVSRIVQRLHNQTVRPTIVVVDNSGRSTQAEPDLSHADDVWTFNENHGPPCRWAPALMDTQHKYTLFVDDDLLPGVRAVEYCLQAAAELKDRFATLGAVGRIYGCRTDGAKTIYRKRNVRRNQYGFRKVDLTCRIHFVLTELVAEAAHYRNLLSWAEVPHHVLCTHDDIILCQSIQRETNTPSYLLPKSYGSKWSLLSKNLPANRAETVSAQPDHVSDRTALIKKCWDTEWESWV